MLHGLECSAVKNKWSRNECSGTVYIGWISGTAYHLGLMGSTAALLKTLGIIHDGAIRTRSTAKQTNYGSKYN